MAQLVENERNAFYRESDAIYKTEDKGSGGKENIMDIEGLTVDAEEVIAAMRTQDAKHTVGRWIDR